MPLDYLYHNVSSFWKVKSANFTARPRAHYMVDCSAGPVTMTLPNGLNAGDGIVAKDATLSWGTHAFTVAPAASGIAMKINGSTAAFVAQGAGDELGIVANNVDWGVTLTGSTAGFVRS